MECLRITFNVSLALVLRSLFSPGSVANAAAISFVATDLPDVNVREDSSITSP